jgi:hypothetical protein
MRLCWPPLLSLKEFQALPLLAMLPLLPPPKFNPALVRNILVRILSNIYMIFLNLYILSIFNLVCVLDARGKTFDIDKDIFLLGSKLPRFNVEIPCGSIVLVGYVVSTYDTDRLSMSFNWAVVLETPAEKKKSSQLSGIKASSSGDKPSSSSKKPSSSGRAPSSSNNKSSSSSKKF